MSQRQLASRVAVARARRSLPPGWTIDRTELFQSGSRGDQRAQDVQQLRRLIERARAANQRR